jgi:hypothetical protein
VHVELLQDMRAMRLDRRDTNRQQIRDVLVAVPFGDELEDLALPL